MCTCGLDSHCQWHAVGCAPSCTSWRWCQQAYSVSAHLGNIMLAMMALLVLLSAWRHHLFLLLLLLLLQPFPSVKAKPDAAIPPGTPITISAKVRRNQAPVTAVVLLTRVNFAPEQQIPMAAQGGGAGVLVAYGRLSALIQVGHPTELNQPLSTQGFHVKVQPRHESSSSCICCPQPGCGRRSE